MRILFLSDGTLLNPIVHSQGIPLLEACALKGDEVHFVSFETSVTKNGAYKLSQKYSPLLKFHSILLRQWKFLPNWFSMFAKGIILSWKLVHREHIQIIHARSLYAGFIGLAVKCLSLHNVALLYDNRGVFIIEEIEKGHWKNNSLKVKFFEFIEKTLLEKSAAIVVVSNKFKEYLLSESSCLHIEKLYVINNKTKIKRIAVDISIKDINIFAVYSGSTAVWQDLDELIKLFKILVDRNIKIKVFSYQTEAFDRILEENSELARSVRVVKLQSENVNLELAKCNFGILLRENNLINNVSSPLKFGEYLAAGLPVMVSEGVGDTEEIINNFGVGVVIKNKNYYNAIEQIEKIISHPNIYNKCLEVAYKEFNIEDSINNYYKIYTKIVKNAGKI